MAFITCHYAADKGGKKNLLQRNVDASRTLTELCVIETNEDVDVHFQVDHTVLLGDMNYRLSGLEPDAALSLIANSGKKRSYAAEGREPSGMTADAGIWRTMSTSMRELGSQKEKGWVTDRYAKFYSIVPQRWDYGSPALSMKSLQSQRELVNEEEEDDMTKEEYKQQGEEELEGSSSDGGGVASGNAEEEKEETHHIAVHFDEEPDDMPASRGNSLSRLSSAAVSILRSASERDLSWPKRIIDGMKRLFMGSKLEAEISDIAGDKTQQDVVETKAWAWVRRHDELRKEMAKGHVFYGFKEGPLAFPPSFRLIPGKYGGDFDRVG